MVLYQSIGAHLCQDYGSRITARTFSNFVFDKLNIMNHEPGEEMRNSIDVLITFYNQETYVDQALSSVLNQKGDFDLHVLVGDDGSTDRTLALLEKWQKQFPKVVQIYRMHRESDAHYVPGFRSSLNRLNLLKQVKSDYFIFLDGDDYFDRDEKLQLQMSILEKEENQDCVACGHAIDAVFHDGNRKPYARLPDRERKYTLKEYWRSAYVHTDTLLVRSNIIHMLISDKIEHHFNDNLITFLVLQQGKLYYYPEPMAVYRQTNDGIWTGSTDVVKNLRNIFLYDLAISINPSLASETRTRFAYSWKTLFRNKHHIRRADLQPYNEEAEDKGLEFSKYWINFEKLSNKEKWKLYKEYLLVMMNSYEYRLRRKIGLWHYQLL